jgi:RNA polymerase sigma factor (sigma-70 family)
VQNTAVAGAQRLRNVPAAPPPNTHSLTAAIARGDERAFERFYQAWFDRAYALARSMTRRDEAFCLDVVQDCMLKVVQRMQPLANESAVEAWMARTIYSTAVDRLRQDQRRQRREQRLATERGEQDPAMPPDQELQHQERQRWLAARLDELPAVDRELLHQRFDAGQTLEAVGAVLGLSGHAAHGRIRRLLAKLADAAKEWFGD